MSKEPEKANMFVKANEDRRKKFVEENSYVADDVMASNPDVKIEAEARAKEHQVEIEAEIEKEVVLANTSNFLIKDTVSKRRCGLNLDAKVDDFFVRLAGITKLSKSEIVNQLLITAILENDDIKELANMNKRVKKILDEFNDGF